MYAIPVVVRSSLLCSIAPVTRERGNKGENKANLTGRIRGSSTPSRPIPVFIKSKESSKRAGQTQAERSEKTTYEESAYVVSADLHLRVSLSHYPASNLSENQAEKHLFQSGMLLMDKKPMLGGFAD